MPGPTDQEQLFLELINEARIDPMRNAARYITSYAPLVSSNPDIQAALNSFHVVGANLLTTFQGLTPTAPLAWNNSLGTAAEKHSAAMIKADDQSNKVAGEASLGDRFKAEGYNYTRLGENVYAFAEDVMHAHARFMVDWGAGPGGMQSPSSQRNNVMWADLSEVGIDVTAETNPATEVGPLVVTQDFGDRGLMFVTGVAYSDNDHDQFYSLGEGRGDLQVQLGSASTTSAASGGYSLGITAGLKTLTLTGGGLAGAVTIKTPIEYDSIKLDVVDGNTLLTSGSIEVDGPISVIREIGMVSWGMTLTAGSGNQRIIGYVGRDTLNGGAGNDVLEGGNNRDTLNGGEGNDELNGGEANDTLDGGSGNDVAVYAGTSSQYTVLAQSGGFTITGSDSGVDTVRNVELFRFANGDFIWNASQGKLTTAGNAPPLVSASQSVSTNEDSPKQVTVMATDSNGDTLTYTAGSAAHGSVTDGAGGVFTYTPIANYNGSDSFTVTVIDGKGGAASQTVNVSVGAQNDAPTVTASQSVTTSANTAKQITVIGSDIDGDPLSYTAAGAAHGTVSGGAGGQFTYAPSSGYSGNDSFTVAVIDGKGGTAVQTVSVSVGNQNDAPTVAASQSVTTSANTAKQITVIGSDIDGDPLSYTAAGAAHGSISGGAGGQFTYTPNSGYSGNDSFAVVVNDGKGGTASHSVNITVTGPLTQPSPSGNDFKLFAPDGYAGEVGGGGTIFGTNGFQEITLVDLPGAVRFDASFNRGGDIIRLPGSADDYTISLNGSSAVLADSDTTYTIPFGTAGTPLVFEDGVRMLVYDGTSLKLGSQSIANGVSLITAPTDHSPLPSGSDPDAIARSFLVDGGETSVGGDLHVFGTTGDEEVSYLYGDLTFDPSFNRGGDTLHLPGSPSDYSAYVAGSSVVILGDDGKITIPIGTAGMTIDFDGVVRVLGYDTETSSIKIGNLEITGTNAGNAIPLDSAGGGSGDPHSLDVGAGSTVITINLSAGVSYLLTDDASKDTSVLINGFDGDDMIRVIGVDASDYNFSTTDGDGDSIYDDLYITFLYGSAENVIVICDVVSPSDKVFDLATAEEAVGGSFITFG